MSKYMTPFTPQRFIESAIKGGWQKDKFDGFSVDEAYTLHINCVVIVNRELDIVYELNMNDVLLDPKAWSAVGKTEGWGDSRLEDNDGIIKVWHFKMDGLMPALRDGSTLEQYLLTLNQ